MNIILLCGSSCSGKTYIRDKILVPSIQINSNIKFKSVYQVTTRVSRPNEREENPYYLFINENIYNSLDEANLLTAKTEVNGNRYGTLKSSLIDEENVYNIVIVNKLGWESFMNSINNGEIESDNLNIKTFRVISDPPNDELKEEHKRSIEYIKKEEDELDKIKVDGYINNINRKANYFDIINEFRRVGLIK